MEVTTRVNLTSLTIKKLETKQVSTLEEFRNLVEEVYEELSNFGKFDAIYVKKEIMEEVVKEETEEIAREILEELRDMEDSVEEIFEDLPDPEVMEHEDSVEVVVNPVMEDQEVNEALKDEILDFRKGGNLRQSRFIKSLLSNHYF